MTRHIPAGEFEDRRVDFFGLRSAKVLEVHVGLARASKLDPHLGEPHKPCHERPFNRYRVDALTRGNSAFRAQEFFTHENAVFRHRIRRDPPRERAGKNRHKDNAKGAEPEEP